MGISFCVCGTRGFGGAASIVVLFGPAFLFGDVSFLAFRRRALAILALPRTLCTVGSVGFSVSCSIFVDGITGITMGILATTIVIALNFATEGELT